MPDACGVSSAGGSQLGRFQAMESGILGCHRADRTQITQRNGFMGAVLLTV